jgi:hypothetical protein
MTTTKTKAKAKPKAKKKTDNPRNTKKKRGGPHKTRATTKICSTTDCENKPVMKFRGRDLCPECLNPDGNFDRDQDIETATLTGYNHMHDSHF